MLAHLPRIMVFFEKGKWFWLEHDKEGYVPVQLYKQQGDSIVARSDSGEVRWRVPTTTCPNPLDSYPIHIGPGAALFLPVEPRISLLLPMCVFPLCLDFTT